MERRKLGKRLSAAFGLLGAIVIFAATTSAQGGANPVQAIQHAIVELQNAVNALQTSVNALSAPEQNNVRITPPLFAPGGAFAAPAGCIVLNVSDGARQIRFQIVGTEFPKDETITLGAGGTMFQSALGRGGTVYCRFTVLDGTRADIRGSLTVGVGITAPGNVTVAAE